MSNVNGVTTLMLNNCILNKHGAYSFPEPHLYRSMVRAHQYVTLTKPNIAFSINKACQLITSHIESHWLVVKHIMRYLSGIINHGFLLSPTPSFNKVSLRAYNDSDWVSDPDDKRYTSGSTSYIVPILSHGALRNKIL